MHPTVSRRRANYLSRHNLFRHDILYFYFSVVISYVRACAQLHTGVLRRCMRRTLRSHEININPFLPMTNSRRPFAFHILLLFIAAWFAGPSRVSGGLPLRLWYDEPAAEWMTSALPVGNGDMGAMFFGGVAHEQVQFNEKTLWSGSPDKRGSYRNFGNIYMDFLTPDTCSGYRRELSLDEAVGRVSYVIGTTRYEREYFASHADSVVVMRLSTPGSRGRLNLALRMVDGEGRQAMTGGNMFLVSGQLDLLHYEAQAVVKAEGGTVRTEDGRLMVSGADAVTVVLAAATDFDLSSPTYTSGDARGVHSRVSARVERASALAYKKLRARHVEDYSRLFGRVDLELTDDVPQMTTDELLRNHKYNNYLDMLCFQYGRYLMISSSRGGAVPSNLQGLWNNVNNPPWECDYHSNINIQMNYWPAEVTNLAECHMPFINYVSTEAMKPDGPWQRVARKEGCRGWAVHTQNNLFGYSDWLINRPANAWYCTHLWQHYAYGLDRGYLRRVAWPVMKETCLYWFDRLKMQDGRLIAPDEWSPEHGPWEDGPAYAQQLIHELFANTLEAAGALGYDDSFVAELREKYALLDNGLHIGSRGQLREWLKTDDTPDDHHRHLSHLMALYPCSGISTLTDRRLADAARVSLNWRGDGATGWSRAWKVACWARLNDGERAYSLLKKAQNITDVTVVSMEDNAGGMYGNLFCAHPSFQIDGNFGTTAAIAEMLLQNTVRGIWLLPALPSEWGKGRFCGLRAHGGFTIDAEWADGNIVKACVKSEAGGVCRLYLPSSVVENVRDNRGRKVKYKTKADGTTVFPTVAGRAYRVVVRPSDTTD